MRFIQVSLKEMFYIIKFLVIMLVAGLLMVASSAVFNLVRMNARDAVRVEDVSSIKLALIKYVRNSPTGYPASTGECLNAYSGVGHELKDARALPEIPTDPLWPAAAPKQTNGTPDFGQKNFCYFYYSDANDQFKISFFLESN